MLAFSKKSPEHTAALDRVRVGACAVFARRWGDPGGRGGLRRADSPPIETVIAFWSSGRRHHFKVFKPVAEVTEADLPPYWLKNALAVSDDFQCEAVVAHVPEKWAPVFRQGHAQTLPSRVRREMGEAAVR